MYRNASIIDLSDGSIPFALLWVAYFIYYIILYNVSFWWPKGCLHFTPLLMEILVIFPLTLDVLCFCYCLRGLVRQNWRTENEWGMVGWSKENMSHSFAKCTSYCIVWCTLLLHLSAAEAGSKQEARRRCSKVSPQSRWGCRCRL